MSLESGRKLGLTASIIALVVPIIISVAYFGFFLSLLGSFSSTVTGSVPTASWFLPFTLLGVVIAAGLVGFIGFVLFMVAMYNLSKYYAEPAIFRNLLNALIVAIVGSIILGVIWVAFVFIAGSLSSPTPAATTTVVWVIPTLGVFLLGVLAIAIYCAVLTRRAFVKLADRSGVDSFRTAGLLFLIGAFVPFVSYVGWVFAAIGYNRLTPTQPLTSYPQYPVPSVGMKRCPNCGAENSADAIYCRNCGRQL
jgi:uncharacterized membrane protein